MSFLPNSYPFLLEIKPVHNEFLSIFWFCTIFIEVCSSISEFLKFLYSNSSTVPLINASSMCLIAGDLFGYLLMPNISSFSIILSLLIDYISCFPKPSPLLKISSLILCPPKPLYAFSCLLFKSLNWYLAVSCLLFDNSSTEKVAFSSAYGVGPWRGAWSFVIAGRDFLLRLSKEK